MPYSRAGKFIKRWLNKHGGSNSTPLVQFDKALKITSQKAEKEWDDTVTDNQKLTVIVPVLDAHIARDNAHGIPVTPLLELRNMALNNALGRPSPISPAAKPPGQRASVAELWIRICYTMLWDNEPATRLQNKTVAKKHLGMNDEQISNVPGNIRKDVIKGAVEVSRLMRLAHEQRAQHGWNNLADYLR